MFKWMGGWCMSLSQCVARTRTCVGLGLQWSWLWELDAIILRSQYVDEKRTNKVFTGCKIQSRENSWI